MQTQARFQKLTKQQRQDKLLLECQSVVINSTLASFGLNMGMFTDRNGGNVTTLYNFERADNEYVHERDHGSYAQANGGYNRSDYEVSQSEWEKNKSQKKESGIDRYTGKEFRNPDQVDLDHVVPIHQIHSNKKNHLAHNTGTEEGREKLKQIANNDKNLVSTDRSINRSKQDKTNQEYVDGLSDERAKELGVDKEKMIEAQKEAEEYIENEANQALFEKQKNELLQTGGQQALAMAIKQALGIAITELASILFTEIRYLVRENVSFNKKTFSELKERVLKHLKHLVKKIPSILKEGVSGGVSGFLSNILTFLINNFLSTSKRIVTLIREGLKSIYDAFKILVFNPEGLSAQEMWYSVIKILSTTVISTLIVSCSEYFITAIKTFIPILSPIADLIGSAIAGIISGIASALFVYALDSIFSKFIYNNDEAEITLMLDDAERRMELSNNAFSQMNNVLNLWSSYHAFIEKNKEIILLLDSVSHISQKIKMESDAVLENINDSISKLQDDLNNKKELIEALKAKKIVLTQFLENHI